MALLYGRLFRYLFFCWACARLAARPEPVLNFTANMSDDEVESPSGAAAEPESKETSGEEMQGTTKSRFRKLYQHEWNKVSNVLKFEGGPNGIRYIQHLVCFVVENYVESFHCCLGNSYHLFLHYSERILVQKQNICFDITTE